VRIRGKSDQQSSSPCMNERLAQFLVILPHLFKFTLSSVNRLLCCLPRGLSSNIFDGIATQLTFSLYQPLSRRLLSHDEVHLAQLTRPRGDHFRSSSPLGPRHGCCIEQPNAASAQAMSSLHSRQMGRTTQALHVGGCCDEHESTKTARRQISREPNSRAQGP
jgi:hypothetical protein